jgi:hypothetical protein
MQRFALSLALLSATLLASVTVAALPGRALAFDIDTSGTTNADGTPRFQDPDEKTTLPGTLQLQMTPMRDHGNPADNSALIPTPQGDMPFWTYSGAPAQRFR